MATFPSHLFADEEFHRLTKSHLQGFQLVKNFVLYSPPSPPPKCSSIPVSDLEKKMGTLLTSDLPFRFSDQRSVKTKLETNQQYIL
jgi:hypothetical protein